MGKKSHTYGSFFIQYKKEQMGNYMENQKLDNELQFSLELTEQVRQETLELNVGYTQADEKWTLIIRYIGDIETAVDEETEVTVLLGGYAIVRISEEKIEALADLPQVIYIEKPRQLQFAVRKGKRTSCFLPVQTVPLSLYGNGVLALIIFMLTSEILTEVRDWWPYGIRQNREDHRKDIRRADCIQKKTSTRYWKKMILYSGVHWIPENTVQLLRG